MEIQAQEAAQNDTQILYEASMRGCVATLNTLIQNDPLILHKISLTPFTETPLHISALLGHVEFTKAIVSQKPQLVAELDSFKRSPLHLAAAEGHSEIVKELLIANKDVSMVADQEGRIPLHLAAMRGRVEVIKELISAKPESIFEPIRAETALHFCVKLNHLDALKVLVASVDDEEFLNSKNFEGNSILQVSTMLQQYETTSYLLSVPKMRVDLNSFIKNGFPAFGGSCRNGTTRSNLQKNPIKETTTKVQTTQSPQKLKSIITSFLKWRRLINYKSDRHEKMRGNLMVLASLIAKMSFQIATSPPGGYWQADATNLKEETCPKGVCSAGTSIHAYTHENEYHLLTFVNTVSFSASISIILWLISGVLVGILLFLEIKEFKEERISEKMQNREKTEMEIQAQEAAQNDTQMPYEASMRGCVATLNTLIQNDPFILHKISLTPFTETPLHISAVLGHVEFTKAIVSSVRMSPNQAQLK
ncbi:ankyrin repeat-containing protein BDA1-like [Mangifera indica]|uniref:ankyrin repeat-containing protein BDA1-like n=1 Tax=Mangifera indica TaxID=29780 RepID=UPI001CFA40B9|nr:ankyrin repeat-containing protein BDA1-like [Mangifera indica]